MSNQTKYTNKLANTRILIIGGSSGIGYAVAEACLEYNALVTISSSNSARIESALTTLKSAYPASTANLFGIRADLSSPTALESELERLLTSSISLMGGQKLDHIVFTAGDALAKIPVTELTLDKIIAAGQIRFFAPLLLAKFIPSHVNTAPSSSYTITTGTVSERPIPNWSVVGSYAGGHHSMVRNLALDLKPVRVNAVSPGPVDTPLWGVQGEEKERLMKGFEGRMATGRVGRVEDVAESYLGVLRDWNVSGSVVRSDGGGMLM